MTMTIQAVYEGGVLRPVAPLALPEGETVAVTIVRTMPAGPSLREPTPAEEDYARRIKAAQSLDEMYAVMATAPPLPEGYDLCQALNANRKATGERLPFPQLDGGSTP
jgi:predicted DNA-binding antitoxin AbrB/MazE fold protein